MRDEAKNGDKIYFIGPAKSRLDVFWSKKLSKVSHVNIPRHRACPSKILLSKNRWNEKREFVKKSMLSFNLSSELNRSKWNVTKCMVSCWGVVQRGGLVPGYPWEVPLRFKAHKSFLFSEGSLKVGKKRHCNLSGFTFTILWLLLPFIT